MEGAVGENPLSGGMGNLPFPAQTKQATGVVGVVQSNVMVVSFSDKILVTVSQSGRLAQWV